jgi:hypothetical protein
MVICPVCGEKYQDDLLEESDIPCPECQNKAHKIIRIELTVDCGIAGLTDHDGLYLFDQMTKLVLGRGFKLTDMEFLQRCKWRKI